MSLKDSINKGSTVLTETAEPTGAHGAVGVSDTLV